jgi:hypothetical protein
VLLIEAVGTITRVVIPDDLIEGRTELLRVGQAVEIAGEVRDFARNPAHVVDGAALAGRPAQLALYLGLVTCYLDI